MHMNTRYDNENELFNGRKMRVNDDVEREPTPFHCMLVVLSIFSLSILSLSFLFRDGDVGKVVVFSREFLVNEVLPSRSNV